MHITETEVAIVGGGAAGIAAARRLTDAGVDCLLIEARDRLGGRAWTIGGADAPPRDLGCGWLHSADRNPWREIAEARGATIDKTPPPWGRPSPQPGFPPDEQAEFRIAIQGFWSRVHAVREDAPDRPAAALVDAQDRWRPMLDAVSSFFSGAELSRVSLRDLARYDDTGVNWRIADGYGATISGHAVGIRAVLGTMVERIDHAGARVSLTTGAGTIAADRAIVTLPSSLIAAETVRFVPQLNEKTEAAQGLPLGLADKLFLSLDHAGEFEAESRLFGHIDRSRTATYHMRPFGRPEIEAYFGGTLAAELEAEKAGAFAEFALGELKSLFGGDFVRRVKPLHLHRWGVDPLARGSYSYAVPGRADSRAILAAPVGDRLFFAGEACSAHDFSTAHGAYRTGIDAAEGVIAARAHSQRG